MAGLSRNDIRLEKSTSAAQLLTATTLGQTPTKEAVPSSTETVQSPTKSLSGDKEMVQTPTKHLLAGSAFAAPAVAPSEEMVQSPAKHLSAGGAYAAPAMVPSEEQRLKSSPQVASPHIGYTNSVGQGPYMNTPRFHGPGVLRKVAEWSAPAAAAAPRTAVATEGALTQRVLRVAAPVGYGEGDAGRGAGTLTRGVFVTGSDAVRQSASHASLRPQVEAPEDVKITHL